LHARISLTYPEYAGKIVGMILTLNEEQIQPLLRNSCELDKQCEKAVQILKAKNEMTKSVTSSSEQQTNNTNVVFPNNLMLNSTVPMFITPNVTLTNMCSTTGTFGDTNVSFNQSLWLSHMNPSTGVVNANYDFMMNSNMMNDIHNSTLPNLSH